MSGENKCVCSPPDRTKPGEVIDHLEAGNKRSRKNDFECLCKPREPIENQEPYVAIVSCADSRVIPERTFDVGPGELFVARVAGNIANDATIASIEYAVANLKVKTIVVMGHHACGAVKEAITVLTKPFQKDYQLSRYLRGLLSQVGAAVKIVGRRHRNKCHKLPEKEVIIENAKVQARMLRESSQIIGSARGLKIYYAYYRKCGEVKFYKL